MMEKERVKMTNVRQGIKKRVGIALLMAIILLWGQWAVPPQVNGQAAEDLVIYEDSLSNEFVDYSWADVDLAATQLVRRNGLSNIL